MGTDYRVQLHRWGGNREELRERIHIRLQEINAELSTWYSDSWISQFNRAKVGQELSVPIHASRVLETAIAVSRQSGGAFDPTIYPLVQAFGFSGDRGATVMLPDEGELSRIQASVGRSKLRLDLQSGKISKVQEGLELDLSAIAKGYAVDQIAAILDEKFVENYLVEIGGEFVAKGDRPSGGPWVVAAEVPSEWKGALPRIALSGRALATSGGAHSYKRIGSETYLHIIDPRTRRPLNSEHAVFSVSVIAENCQIADALSTAAFVLGPNDAEQLKANYPEAAFLFLMRDGSLIEL